MVEEMESLIKNKAWTLVDRPRNQIIVSCEWIFKTKEGILGVEKVRLVARGFTQREGVDYNEIFSLVVKHSSIRMILALVADRNMELEQLDVKVTFLHGELEETVYMQQPEGFVKDKNKSFLQAEFEMEDLGPAQKILGMEITRDRQKGELYLSQRSYIKKVIDRFGIKDAKPVSTPMAHYFKLTSSQSPTTDEEEKFMAKVPYASAVGSVMYSMKADLQAVVALSTTEAEYITETEAIKEAIWLKGITEELGLKQKAKHIDVKMPFVREIVTGGTVVVVKISTEDNLADMITKAITTGKFRHCLSLINIQECSSPLKVVTSLIRRN
ncbi:Retrovirus-related Pol polyprotein from transposon TNT 1-94 [Vitis vinifera]|uniref:Retrovirus-related Pol polyprotein from transposon TNT 1-94 n=1 Tax=Vitis vinifera TaxID=29760 RepID=A0A438CQB5_VITVI|nr:Retrovirus-related Pol polyprotein from transposon TNT 1-94 [Vitis vinifera]